MPTRKRYVLALVLAMEALFVKPDEEVPPAGGSGLWGHQAKEGQCDSDSARRVGVPVATNGPRETLLEWIQAMGKTEEEPLTGTGEHERPAAGPKPEPDQRFVACFKEAVRRGDPGVAATDKGDEASLTFDETAACRKRFGIVSLKGHFSGGLLTGPATVAYEDDAVERLTLRDGVPSGLYRKFGCRFGACDFTEEAWNVPNVLEKVFYFVRGKKVGPGWEFKIGGGAVVGKVDDRGELTGDDVVYVYPDYNTLLVGTFQNGTMVAAKSSVLVGLDVDPASKIPLLVCDRQKLGQSRGVHSYQEPTKSAVRDPLVRDPMEEDTVYVSTSTQPGAGLGLFVKKFCPKNSVVSFYAGIKRGSTELPADRSLKSVYTIDNDWAVSNQVIDIPSYYRSLDTYNASLAHYSNHRFESNAWFGMVFHPKFGHIRTLVLERDLHPGEEVFTNYGYLDKYMQIESGIRNVYKLGMLLSVKSEAEFATTVKKYINVVRDSSGSLTSFLKAMKGLSQFSNNMFGHF